jgi:hypothetical protein
VDALRRVERVYRARLIDEPTDMVARLSLAWCLFLQALHRAGEERALATVTALELAETVSDGGKRADDLLSDCLRQAITVMQLSPDPNDRTEIEKLHSLVKISGGGQAISEAEQQAKRILEDIAREMQSGGPIDPTRPPRPA